MLVLALLDSGSKVNAIHLTFAKELSFSIWETNNGIQKIDSTMLDTFEIVVVAFSIIDKANQVRFFEETFLMANISREIVFGMLFPTLSGANVDFLGRKLRWKTYITKEAFSTTKRVKLIGKKEFAAAALDMKS